MTARAYSVADAYNDAAILITALVNEPDEAGAALDHIAHTASRDRLVGLLMAALHSASAMVTAEAAASILAGEEGVAGPALDALLDLRARAQSEAGGQESR